MFVLDPSVHCAVHQQITRYKLLKKRLLLTFCVVDMLIIVTELDRLLKIGPLQLSIAVSGWYLLSRYDSHGNLQMSQNPPLKNDFSGYAWCDNTTSVSVAGQTIVETTFSRKSTFSHFYIALFTLFLWDLTKSSCPSFKWVPFEMSKLLFIGCNCRSSFITDPLSILDGTHSFTIRLY